MSIPPSYASVFYQPESYQTEKGGGMRLQTEAKRQVNVSEAISEPKLIEMIEAKWRDIECRKSRELEEDRRKG